MNIGDITTLVTPAGEFVGRLKSVKDDTGVYVLSDPRMFMHDDQRGSGLIPGVSMTGEQDPTEAIFHMVVVAHKSSKETEEAWMSATSGIVLT